MTGSSHATTARGEFFRYLAVSVIGLGIDLGCLLIAAEFMHYLWAATIGFVAGAVTSYLLAVSWAFRHRRLGSKPHLEFAAYVAVGMAGLSLNNVSILIAVEVLMLPLPFAKLAAAAATFIFNFVVRKWWLFRP